MIKTIINWFKSSNHYYHTLLIAALAVIMLSIGSFEFGAQNLLTNVWQTIKFGVLSGLLIEAYQVITSRKLDLKNSLGDIVADVVGLIVGILLYIGLTLFSPISAICTFILSVVTIILAFTKYYNSKQMYVLFVLFIILVLSTFSLFIYA